MSKVKKSALFHDSESGYYVKDERIKQFAYSFHAAADRNGFVLGTIVTPGNTHEIVKTKLIGTEGARLLREKRVQGRPHRRKGAEEAP